MNVHAMESQENAPSVQRKLLFQGLSVKQTEAQFNVKCNESTQVLEGMKGGHVSKNTSTAKRRALGDISNAERGDMKMGFQVKSGQEATKNTSFLTNDMKSTKYEIFMTDKSNPVSDISTTAKDEIENAYGGLPDNKEDLHVEDLRHRMEEEILEWQNEADKRVNSIMDDVNCFHAELPHIDIPQDIEEFIEDENEIEIPHLFNEEEIEYEIIHV